MVSNEGTPTTPIDLKHLPRSAGAQTHKIERKLRVGHVKSR
jgi:hypothetical protein